MTTTTPTMPGTPPDSRIVPPSGGAGNQPSAPMPPKTDGPVMMRPARLPRIRHNELLGLTTQLSIMTKAGIDIASSLQSLARQARRPQMREMLEAIHHNVIGGQSISNALRPYERVFGESYVASIAAGEISGRLPDVLHQLAQLQRSEIRLRSTLRTILAYPVLLASVSFIVLTGLVVFVLPQFAQIFDQFEVPLPALTQVLLAVSTEIRTRFWLWGGLLLLIGGGGFAFLSSAGGRRFRDSFYLNAWLLRDISRSLLIGRSCRMLGIMIDSGVPLLQSLQLARKAVRNQLYQELFSQLEHEVVNGQGLGESLMRATYVPAAAAEMIATAERTGSMGMVTELLGEHYEEEGETRLREAVTILEPAIIIGMGALVATIVLAVMLPMFELATLA